LRDSEGNWGILETQDLPGEEGNEMMSEILQLKAVASLLTALGRLPAVIMLGLSFLLLLGLGALYYWVIPPNLSLTVLYLLPIAIATWFVSARPGQLLAFLSAALTYGVLYQRNAPLLNVAWEAGTVWAIGAIGVELLHSIKMSAEVGKQLSRIDSATGAVNRRFFTELLEAEFHRAERYRFALTVAYIDLDNFKQLNERLGHQSGDELLYRFVEQLSEALRANDVVARLGGDEFALLLPQTNDVQAQQVFTRLQPQMKDALEAETIPIQYSIAVVTFLEMPDMVEDITEQAEALLQSIKTNGKNRLEYQVLP
jgi:diguanylate cyclase (GGDEF)-like protein